MRVGALLNGDVPDGANVVMRGRLDAVTVKASVQSGQWAAGRLVDAADSIEVMIFPRAFARIGRSGIKTDAPVAVVGRVSISEERIALVVNSIERISA
ncbi:hypothetical protein A3K89_22125 [Rhodococcoides kyotonense]|uniref:OB-fold nucleic acid binding domain-containing protein n=1 Tax=Rhodococcoides kyotonense TaxID=398843 RepID=A0A177YF20_9NOCA|nr:hypothetical protein A3K89_22125 [Rhodococcus kyotonensis]